MKKINGRDIKVYLLGAVTTLIAVGLTTVYASGLISGLNISYDNSNSGLTSTDVKNALDELYTISETHCPTGYTCKLGPACEYEEGTSWDFAYVGNSEEFKVPCSGTYKFEVWGAQGGSAGGGGAKGAYLKGEYQTTVDTRLFIVVGGAGGASSTGWNGPGTSGAGGYNGGGGGRSNYNNNYSMSAGGGGGGATHIALSDGLIATVEPLIVAGGGGGGWKASLAGSSWENASAGGSTSPNSNNVRGNGSSTQNTVTNSNHAGGGGGYYGGTVGMAGTNYFDPVLTNTYSVQGQQSGNGMAKITLVQID